MCTERKGSADATSLNSHAGHLARPPVTNMFPRTRPQPSRARPGRRAVRLGPSGSPGRKRRQTPRRLPSAPFLGSAPGPLRPPLDDFLPSASSHLPLQRRRQCKSGSCSVTPNVSTHPWRCPPKSHPPTMNLALPTMSLALPTGRKDPAPRSSGAQEGLGPSIRSRSSDASEANQYCAQGGG